MAKKQILKKKEASLPGAIGIGLAVSMFITLLGTALTAYLMERESLAESGIGAAAVIIQLLSAASGGLIAFGILKRQRVVVCSVSALSYMLVLFGMTALVFGGQYQGVGATILAIIGGGILSILPGIIGGKRGNKMPKLKSFR